MSRFQELQNSHLLERATPLPCNGTTCLAYTITIEGKKQFLKRLRPEFEGNPHYIALLNKEFELGQSLSHPNLIRYNSLRATAEGHFILMDYVNGETLTEKLSNHPEYFKSKANLQRFVSQLLDCLSYLHSHQVLHLDLKPDNIMITHIGHDVKLFDLGFSYADSFDNTPGRTDEFAAPEQFRKDLLHIGIPTDIYAVGMILKEINQHTPLPATYAQLMKQCLQEDPTKRPQHVNDLTSSINHHNIRYLYRGGGGFLVLLILAFLFFWWSKSNSSASQKPVISDHVYYRVLSEDNLTAEALGTYFLEKDRPNAMIAPSVKINNRMYQVTAVHDSAFYQQEEITSIYIPEGVERLGAFMARFCYSLYSISMPASVTEVGTGAFWGCNNLKDVKLSPSLTELAADMFVSCLSLQRIDVPEGVKRILVDCFVGCTQLTEVNLPSTLESLDRGVFYECTSLEEITIPASVSSIGEYTFMRCFNLKDVYNLAPVPQPVNDIFGSLKPTLHVPAASVALYADAPYWKDLIIVPIK